MTYDVSPRMVCYGCICSMGEWWDMNKYRYIHDCMITHSHTMFLSLKYIGSGVSGID